MIRSRERGFTLIELLVVLAVLGLLATLAYGWLRLVGTSENRAADHLDQNLSQEAVTHVVRTMIEQAYPAFLSDNYIDRTLDFDGTPDALQVVAPLPEAVQSGAMAHMRLFAAPARGRTALQLSWALDLRRPDGSSLPRHVAHLYAPVAALQIRYFAPTPGAPAGTWVSEWQMPMALPSLIRVEVWLSRSSSKPWIDVTAAPFRTVNIECLYDPLETGCRRSR